MVDTVVLTIPGQYFEIFDGSKFSPQVTNEAKKLSFGGQGYQKYTQNPSRTEFKGGVYRPRVTYIRRLVANGLNESLRLEFSAPKLLFQNNVDEVEENDFDKIIKALEDSLHTIGVKISTNHLPYSHVSAIHYCKNIPFTDYTSANYVIKSLSRIDIPKNLDFNHRHFQNGGQALYIHSNRHQFVIYDKCRDLGMPKGRSIDSNDSLFQQNLFEEINKHLPFELVRMEVRVTHRQKLQTLLKKINLDNLEPNFRNLFSRNVAQKMLIHYWQTYFEDLRYQFTYNNTNDPEKILSLILNNSKYIRCNHALSLLAIYLFANSTGLRPLKTILQKKYTRETWYRLNEEFLELSDTMSIGTEKGFVSQIESALSNFSPYKLELERRSE